MRSYKSEQFKKDQYKKAVEKARSWGGKCLSGEYVGCMAKMKWQCEKGHKSWSARYDSVVTDGRWCPECKKLTLSEKLTNADGLNKAIKHAESKEGKCLSDRYVGAHEKMEWKCKKGHESWSATYHNVVNCGKWCPECNGERFKEESIVRMFFEEWDEANKFKSVKHEKLINPRTGMKLEIDGFCEESNVGFEYNDRQHYYRKKTMERDNIKYDLCQKAGIKLVIVKYARYSMGETLFGQIKKGLVDAELLDLNKPDEVKRVDKAVDNVSEKLAEIVVGKATENVVAELIYLCGMSTK